MKSLEAALSQRYPKYQPEQVSRLAKLVTEAVAEAVSVGKTVVFVELDEFGTVSLEGLVVMDQAR